jgi:hypothetical protein
MDKGLSYVITFLLAAFVVGAWVYATEAKWAWQRFESMDRMALSREIDDKMARHSRNVAITLYGRWAVTLQPMHGGMETGVVQAWADGPCYSYISHDGGLTSNPVECPTWLTHDPRYLPPGPAR